MRKGIRPVDSYRFAKKQIAITINASKE